MASELVHVINVTEAKRRFSELIERVGRGERIIIARRGTPVMGIVPPNEVGGPARGVTRRQPVGLAAVAGALPTGTTSMTPLPRSTRNAIAP